ncbi:MAG: sigma-54-dependent Fis family transcriptional regulator [Deltaproteobacteria bacterium]|nr:sigma-54-dependent Fis family transcriptional regulator [Deltaproteobacteria bacterium]
MANILIIDDDDGVVHTMSRLVEDMGHNVDSAFTIKEGLKKIASSIFNVVLLDVNLPDGSGLDIVDDIVQSPFSPQVIIMTAFSDPDGAELAINNGAWDYVEKPASPIKFRLQISRALLFQEQKRISDKPIHFSIENIIGDSKELSLCIEQALQMAKSEANVIITGETGTGKELFAEMIHNNSIRKKNSFIVVDCSILSKNFIESVLFGHEKGSFTGADKKRNGLVSLSDNGTLFLDEVGELPLSTQSAFLRVLQEKRFRPVGSEHEISSDFRVIAATNKNLEQMVHQGKFRNDLLYRLKSYTIELPALRNRDKDIEKIAIHYIKQFCNQYKLDEKEISPDFLETLMKYKWPGNVRELVSTIEACVSTTPMEKCLFAYHLPRKIRTVIARTSIKNSNKIKSMDVEDFTQSDCSLTFKDLLSMTEKNYLTKLYSQTEGDIKKLCRVSGLSRAVLYRKLKKHQIKSN